MNYEVHILRSAVKEMRRLPVEVRRRTDRKLLSLETRPYGVGHKKLAAGAGYRAAVGDYRILYDVDDQARIVTVIAVRHRREAYR